MRAIESSDYTVNQLAYAEALVSAIRKFLKTLPERWDNVKLSPEQSSDATNHAVARRTIVKRRSDIKRTVRRVNEAIEQARNLKGKL